MLRGSCPQAVADRQPLFKRNADDSDQTRRVWILAGLVGSIRDRAISGFSHAETAVHHRPGTVERSSNLPKIQTETSSSFAAMPPLAAEPNTHVYHGGPKSND